MDKRVAPFNRETPVIIEDNDTQGAIFCAGCGTHGGVRFSLRVSATQRQIMPWCKDCAEKIALHLIRTWDR